MRIRPAPSTRLPLLLFLLLLFLNLRCAFAISLFVHPCVFPSRIGGHLAHVEGREGALLVLVSGRTSYLLRDHRHIYWIGTAKVFERTLHATHTIDARALLGSRDHNLRWALPLTLLGELPEILLGLSISL